MKAGQNAEAYPLLYGYVQPKLDHLREVEKQHTNLLDVLWREGLRELKAGRAGQDFFRRYQAASQARQEEMVEEYIHTKMQQDWRLQQTLVALKDAGKIVNLTLDLGILQLNRAQGFQQPAARQAELEAAEKTFLAIRSFAGDTEEYQMFLGQVYCWLGKAAAGREQFDKLLAKHQRACPILMSLANTYRDLGDDGTARELIEEAYQKAGDSKQKHAAASFRARVQKDTDDQIAWLEKCDTNEVYVQVELHSARGERLLEKGDKTGAATLLAKAIAGYQQLPKSTATLNNCGLACFRLHSATGDLAHRSRGLAMLKEAVDLDPGDSILLKNTLQFLIADAIRETVGDALVPEVNNGEHGFSLLGCLYRDEAGRAEVAEKLRATASMKAALGLLDRALLLAPKDAHLYDVAQDVYLRFKDADGMRKLHERFRISSPDLDEVRQQTLEQYTTGADTNLLQSLAIRRPQAQALLEKPAVRSHPRSRQVVLVQLVNLGLLAEAQGEATDLSKLLAVAEEANQLISTSTGQATLASVCAKLAVAELSQQNAAFAALARNHKTSLNALNLLTLGLEHNAGFAATAQTNQYVRRLVELIKARCQVFPNRVDPSEWALMRVLDPNSAATMSDFLKQNELERLSQELSYQMNPWQAENVLDVCWMYQMLGESQRAEKVYRESQNAGVPLP